MFKYFLLLSFRNSLREFKITLINLLGLSLGMAAVILLYLYMVHELSFEKMHSQRDKIYRVITQMEGDEGGQAPFTHGAVGPVVADEIPEIKSFVRIAENNTAAIRGETRIGDLKMLMVDSTFFNFFDFEVKQGVGNASLKHSRQAVITESLAQRLFPGEDPVGQSFELTLLEVDLLAGQMNQSRKQYHVGALMEQPPSNTHLQFDLLVPVNDMDSMMFNFGGFIFATYFLLDQPMHADLHDKIAGRAREIAAEPLRTQTLMDMLSVDLQGLNDIRFGQIMAHDISPQGNKQTVVLFMVLAVFILIIVLANFINLSTARSEKRMVEAGIRKVLGSDRRDIILHYIGESVLITFVGVLISLIVIEVFLPAISGMWGNKLYLGSFLNIRFFGSILLFTLLTGVLAGIYPALHFSRFQPGAVLKGRFFSGQSRPVMRYTLVVFQFAISVFLVICVWIFFDQLSFMQKKDNRIDTENILVFDNLTPGIKNSFMSLREELQMNPRVEHVIAATGMPGMEGFGVPLRRADQGQEDEISATSFAALGNYKEFFNLNLKKGNWLDERGQRGGLEFVINETASRRLGYENPIGQDMVFYNSTGKIVGVVEDFHFESRHYPIRPLVFTPAFGDFQLLAVKVNREEMEKTRAEIVDVLQKADRAFASEGVWLDQILQRHYAAENRIFKITRMGSIMAVLIGLIGLIGLTSYLILARKKEICIRKVIGAGYARILFTLMSGMLKWVVLANIIAWPLAWWAARYWLDNFAYSIDISPWYFLTAGMGSVMIAMLIIASQSYREVLRNPVEGLRAE